MNKAGSVRHADEITKAMEATGLPVLGVLPRDAGIEAPSRHLGLVPAAERAAAAASVTLLSERLAAHVDLTAILAIAHTATPLAADAWDPGAVVRPASGSRPVVAIAAGRAFTFRYAETDELLRAAGCEPVTFDPLTDPALPPGTAGLYLGGGFPEVHAAELSATPRCGPTSTRRSPPGCRPWPSAPACCICARPSTARRWSARSTPTATMSDRLTLSYRRLVADHDQLLAAAGTPGDRARVPPHGRRAGGRRIAGLAGRRPAGGLRSRHPARQLPARALGRASAAGAAVRRRGARVRRRAPEHR